MPEFPELKTDEEVARLVQTGDKDSFKMIIDRYENKIMRYANKFLYQYEDRQDAVQDVFLKAYQNIQSFDSDRSFSPWIYRIAHNTFINIIKKKGKESLTFFDTDTLFARSIPDQKEESQRETKEIKEILDQTLAKISPKYREVIVLYYFEDKSYDEIAEIMQIPRSTVGVRLKRGRDQLKKHYEE